MSICSGDFTIAIQTLHDTWNSITDLGGSEWQDITMVQAQAISAIPYLRLTKSISNPASSSSIPTSSTTSSEPSSQPEPELPLEESDPESLPPQGTEAENVLITYSILHSPTYLVPTLYITLSPPPPSAESLYTLLVPALYKPSLQNPAIGIIGALSATTHPETGRSCYWIHPCLTQEGMEGVGVHGGVEYLMGWIGIVGGGVGLGVPVDVARAALEGHRESLDGS